MIFQSGIFFAQFRISDHSLEIEKGRYNKTPCEERLCKNSGIIEDEAHFYVAIRLLSSVLMTVSNRSQ
jgi:hypothetical protein